MQLGASSPLNPSHLHFPAKSCLYMQAGEERRFNRFKNSCSIQKLFGWRSRRSLPFSGINNHLPSCSFKWFCERKEECLAPLLTFWWRYSSRETAAHYVLKLTWNLSLSLSACLPCNDKPYMLFAQFHGSPMIRVLIRCALLCVQFHVLSTVRVDVMYWWTSVIGEITKELNVYPHGYKWRWRSK